MDQLHEKAFQLRSATKIRVRLTSEEPLKKVASGNW
jgi:hypothetical protein